MRRAAAALVLASLALASGARAAGQSAADALFEEGLKLFDAGRTHEACERFEASLHLDPALGTLQNLATCHEQDGRTARAHAEFVELAERAAKAGPGQKARELLGRQRAAALVKRLSQVELRFGADANVAEIRVDGDVLARDVWHMPVSLDPGTHPFLFTAPGRQPVTRVVPVSAAPGVAPVEVPRLEGFPPPPAPGGVPLRTVALALGGAGALGVVLGAVFGGLTFAKKGEAGPHCSGIYCDAQGLSLQSAAHGYATASTTAFVLGLAAGGAGAFLYVWGGPEARITFGVTPQLSGLRVDGVW